MPTTESSPTRARLPRRGAWHAWTYRTQTSFWPSRLPVFRLTLKPSQVHAPASPQVPILVDGDTELVESLLVVEYLDAKYPEPIKLLPEDPAEAAKARPGATPACCCAGAGAGGLGRPDPALPCHAPPCCAVQAVD